MSWVAAGVASAGLTLSAVKWVSGNNKEKKAKRERANIKAPFYDIQNEYYQNVNQANQLAQGGLPAATKDYYTEKSQQGLTAGIKGVLSGGGNPNDISTLLKTYDDGIAKIGAIDAETHINNIKYYRDVNKDLAGQKTIQWSINKQQPYLSTLKELSAAQKAGEATKWEAANDAMSSISSFGTSMAGGKGFGNGKGSGATSSSVSGHSGNAATRSDMGSTFSRVFADSSSPETRRSSSEEVHTNVPDPFGGTTSSGNDDEMYQQFKTWLNKEKI